MYPEHIGRAIRKFRKEAKMSQAQLAEQVNTGRSNIAMIELGKNRNPTLGTICRIFNTLGYGVKIKLVKLHENEY